MNSNRTELVRNKLFTNIKYRTVDRPAQTVWFYKSPSSLLNVYFRLGGFQSSVLLIHLRYSPNTE